MERSMFCIEGQGQPMLCVYGERSVRTPREALRLLTEGCAREQPQSAAMRAFQWSLRSVPGLASPVLPYRAGRLVVRSTSMAAHAKCEALVEFYGLSCFDGRRTRAFVDFPRRFELARCCELLRAHEVMKLELATPERRFAVRVQADGFKILTFVHCPRESARLRLLGFSQTGGCSLTARGVSSARAAELLTQVLGDGERPRWVRVTMTRTSPVALVS